MTLSLGTGSYFTPRAPLKTFRLYKKSKTIQPKEQIDYLTKNQAQYSYLYGRLNAEKQSDPNNGLATYLEQFIKDRSDYGIINIQKRFRQMWLTNEIIASKIPISVARKLYDCQALANITGTPNCYFHPLSDGWFMDYIMKTMFDDQATKKLSKRQLCNV